jgi:hypothetical protein
VKTSNLIGPALDYAVAKCEGVLFPRSIPNYSTDWSQGGPIIEREGIELICNLTATEATRFKDQSADWRAFYRQRRSTDDRMFATTPLVAAMRMFVRNRLGDTVDLPKEVTV